MSDNIIKIIPAFKFLFEGNYRYRVTYGGRGKGASWNYVRALLILAMQNKRRFLCCREIQHSIKESVHKLLSDQIETLGLSKGFTITETSIKALNGSEFIFEGLFRNVNRIKSLEGIDYCLVEEAETVSEDSWQLLLPTIRNDKSEIWIIFNTRYEDDPTYQRFVANAPNNAIVRKINYDQNPFFPDVLKREMENDKAFRPNAYKNVWLGEPIGKGRKVWPDFDEKIHVKEIAWSHVKESGNCYMAMDPAQHYYPACIWCAVIPKLEGKGYIKYIYNEWPTFDVLGDNFHNARTTTLYTGTLSDMARAFYVFDGTAEYGLQIRNRFIDTRFAKGSGSGSYFSNSTMGIVSEFAKRDNGGLVFNCPGEKQIDIQRSIITNDMQYNHLTPFSAINDVSLVIAPWCTNMIISLTNHRLEDDSEQESAKYKDFSDALRIMYAGLTNFRYEDPMPKSEEKEQYEYACTSSQTDNWMC